MPNPTERPSLPSLFDLQSRVAIVTGGAGLLGSEFCKTLVGAGAQVVIADLDLDAAERLANSLHADDQTRVNALAVATDVTDPDSVQTMVGTALQAFGRLDILVNSAAMDPKFDPDHSGGLQSSAFEDYPLTAWRQALEVNLTGAFLCCQAAVAPMLEQGRGVILNLCSSSRVSRLNTNRCITQ
jgi:NAD(P)-dependent dehydrogenase (short-subunit alcohol dehydrogenase family)